MFRLAQKVSVLGNSAKLIVQQERAMSKAVVFNMNGAMVTAMSPVLETHARRNNMSETELAKKLFNDGDKDLIAKVEPDLLSKQGSYKANLAHVMSAVQSIRADGIKTGLVTETRGLNAANMPVDNVLFDVTSPTLKGDMCDKLGVDSSEVIYLDNSDGNLKAAQGLGMTTIKVEDVEAALTQLESHLKVPLKEFVPGFTWTFWDKSNNPYNRAGENVLYYFLCLYLFLIIYHYTFKKVLHIDGTYQE